MLTKGKRIRLAIERAELNQKNVATFCGVTDQAVSGWIKTSKIKSEHLERVASLTKTRMEWLQTGKGPMEDVRAIEDALALGKRLPAAAANALPGKTQVRLARLFEYLRDGRLSPGDFDAIWQMVERLVDREEAEK